MHATMVASIALGSSVAEAAPTAQASRYASIVVEAETGNVLYERNADLPRYPASLTKVMTLYLTFEAIKANKLKLTDDVPMSAYAVVRDPSRLDLSPGAKIKVEDAIRAMTTKSANDAACAMGEKLAGGSESSFASIMNAKAKALGLTKTNFRNASGLPEEGHVSSARDLATLCRALVRDFPEYYAYFNAESFQFRGTRYKNQNRFLRTYYGADGIKTGFVNASGHNLAASAVRGDKRLIAIVLGGDTQAWTRQHATRLLDVSYAKLDPSLVMVASNAVPEEGETEEKSPLAMGSVSVSVDVSGGSSARAAAPAAETYATPAGAVTVVSKPVIPLPNATANLAANAAAVNPAPAPTPAAAQGAPAPAARASETPLVAAAAPATEEVTEDTIARELLVHSGLAAADPTPRPSVAPAPRVVKDDVPVRSLQRSAAPAAATKQAAERSVRIVEPGAAPAGQPEAQVPAGQPRSVERPAEQPEAAPAPVEVAAEAAPAAEAGGEWSVQVGLFRDATVARRRGEEARKLMPLALRGADLVVGRALDGVHITSRISRLSEQDARAACSELQRGRVPCVVVPPGRPLVVATN